MVYKLILLYNALNSVNKYKHKILREEIKLYKCN